MSLTYIFLSIEGLDTALPSVGERRNYNCTLHLRRLIKEGICDKTSVPSVSAISRLLRGRDEEEVKKTSESLSAHTKLLTIKGGG